ncbi:hypothetical protein LJK88_38150 [Paenibacillus sp. P26]|nr:hypothetical protein LJK88_38150 [Paenibacillus sp. P26]UUZ93268.1 hypothetical protein LJK87_00150 [Paenibacillus sp. P25]
MSIDFVLKFVLLVTFFALCLGTAIKFWMYGIRDLYLLLSPVVIIGLVLVLPVVIFNVVLFHFEKIEGKLKEHHIIKNSMSLSKRITLGIVVCKILIEQLPLLIGWTAQIISKSLSSRRETKNYFQIILSSDLLWKNKHWKRFV